MNNKGKGKKITGPIYYSYNSRNTAAPRTEGTRRRRRRRNRWRRRRRRKKRNTRREEEENARALAHTSENHFHLL